MAYIKLRDFAQKTDFPSAWVLHLLTENTLDMRIDPEGFLEISLSDEVIEGLLSRLANDSANGKMVDDFPSGKRQEMEIRAEKIIREQLEDMVQQAIERFIDES